MKITFLGAGSTIFAKNVLGDCILTPSLGQFDIALYDIDRERLECSFKMLNNINRRYGKARIARYTDLKSAFGQTLCITFANCSKTGAVLKKRKIPPIPKVSPMVWRKPYFFGTSKSVTVQGLYPPT